MTVLNFGGGLQDTVVDPTTGKLFTTNVTVSISTAGTTASIFTTKTAVSGLIPGFTADTAAVAGLTRTVFAQAAGTSTWQAMDAHFSPTPTKSVKAPYTAAAGDRLQVDAFSRSVTDGVTNSTTTVTSATGFTAADVGRQISGAGIPAGSTIQSLNSGTSVVIGPSPATASAAGVTLTIGGPVPVVLPAPSASQDPISAVKADSSSNAVTFTVAGGALINGVASQTTTVQNGGATFIPDATATNYLVRR